MAVALFKVAEHLVQLIVAVQLLLTLGQLYTGLPFTCPSAESVSFLYCVEKHELENVALYCRFPEAVHVALLVTELVIVPYSVVL